MSHRGISIHAIIARLNQRGSSHAVPLAAILIHLMLLFILFCVSRQAGLITESPSDSNLVNFDALWYESIVKQGYYYLDGSMNTMAFFPLFPYTWKLTGLSPAGISVFNAVIYLTGMYLIIKQFRFSLLQALLVLSTPSLFFCYIPYSESIFFLGATFILLGLEQEKPAFTFLGTVITSLTRSVGIVFLPAFLFTLLIHWKGKEANITRRTSILWSCAIIIISTFLVILLQYIETGEWLAFFKVQRSWNRSLSLPVLPFTTLSGLRMLWLDGIAFFIAVVSAVTCCGAAYLFLFKRKLSTNTIGTDFAFVYLATMGFVCSFFSGVWETGTGTSLMSLNRYIFAGPFFIFFISRMIFSAPASPVKHLVWLVILIVFTWLSLGAYVTLDGHQYYWQTILYFICMAAYIFLYSIIRFAPSAGSLLYVVNLLLQLYLFNTYLSNKWVG